MLVVADLLITGEEGPQAAKVVDSFVWYHINLVDAVGGIVTTVHAIRGVAAIEARLLASTTVGVSFAIGMMALL